MLYVEQKWKETQKNLIRSGINDIKQWALSSLEVIESINTTTSARSTTALNLTCLFT